MNNICNYALFLADIKRDYAESENYYKRALSLNPEHINTLYNYGVKIGLKKVLYQSIYHKNEEAKEIYDKILSLSPNHGLAL